MASAPPLEGYTGLERKTDPRGLTLADILQMSPHETLMAGLALAGQDLGVLDAGTQMMRPAREVSDPWGARISAEAQARQQGAVGAMQNIPYSPLAAGVELAAAAAPKSWEVRGAYDAMTRPVEGANPEAPNMLASLDNLTLGGLIEAPMAQGLLRTKPPSLKSPTAARLRGRPAGEETMTEPFYSQVRTVLEDPKTQGTQTGEAWAKFLTDPKRGVKAEEMKWCFWKKRSSAISKKSLPH